MLLDIGNTFHTGFVVPSIEDAQAELGQVFDATWTAIELRDMPVVLGDGRRDVVPLRFTYSMGPTPRIELLEPIPGTPWQVPERDGVSPHGTHHVGVWCDDFAATSRRLEEAGCPRLVTFDDGSGDGRAVRFAYHQLPSGPLVELVDSVRRPVLEAWFAGEAYPMTDPDDFSAGG